jgi:hypothetical protein
LPKKEIVAFEGKQQIGEIGPRNGYGPGGAQACHDCGVLAGWRGSTSAPRACGTGGTLLLDRIFDAERDAVQGTIRSASRQHVIGPTSLLQGPIRKHVHGSVDFGVNPRNLLQVGLDELLRGKLTPTNERGLLRCGRLNHPFHSSAA